MPTEVTSPLKLPVNDDAVPLQFPVTFPTMSAVTTFAEKFPDESRLTIVKAVAEFVAFSVVFVAVAMLVAVAPPTDATVGPGYEPDKSPEAVPAGATPEMVVSETDVIKPCESTVMCGTRVAVPNVPAPEVLFAARSTVVLLFAESFVAEKRFERFKIGCCVCAVVAIWIV